MEKMMVVPEEQTNNEKRVVHMQGAVNFRDLGGYKTKDGREVKWGRVFRAGDISRLSGQDLQVLSQKNIRTVIDFRTVKESQEAPDQLLPGTDYLLCPAGSERLADTQQIVRLLLEGSFLPDFYSNTQYLGERYKPLFCKLLAIPENEALMYHCTGGRDRTGIATALLLHALDVPQETIEADYVISNTYLQSTYGHLFHGVSQAAGIEVDTLVKAMELKPELIRLMFSAIETKYGSTETFFQQELGLERRELALLKEKFTT